MIVRKPAFLLAVPVAAVLIGAAAALAVLASSSGSPPPPPEPPAVRLRPEPSPLPATTIPSPTPEAPATPEPTPTPPADCQPLAGPDPLDGHQVLAYYGNPYTPDMGILGEFSPQALLGELLAHAAVYDSLNDPLGVQPALHLVYATAQSEPYNGLYLLYVDDETTREYIDLACENGLLIFLDLQIGLSDVESEVAKVLPYLEQPHVHLALDPEFAMAPDEVPGEAIGSLDASDVNAAQAMLQSFLEERDLPNKILVVHQFIGSMLTRPELLEEYPLVNLVIDMDGFGPAEIKRVKYGWYAAPAPYAGIKLFFRQDPDLMSEAEVLELEPDVIIYQ